LPQQQAAEHGQNQDDIAVSPPALHGFGHSRVDG
jgi:hypothetical protein